MYLVYLLALSGLAWVLYSEIAGSRPATIEDLVRGALPDSPERLVRRSRSDGFEHDLRPSANVSHESVTYATNSDGLRSDREYPVERIPGRRRVLLLGDSFVFGWGLPVDQTMTAQLESISDPSGWEFLNFGVPAFNTENEVSFLIERGLKYRPDIVVLVYHPNDGTADSRVAPGVPSADQFVDYLQGSASGEIQARVIERLERAGSPLAPGWNASPSLSRRDRDHLVRHFLPPFLKPMRKTLAKLRALSEQHGFSVEVAILPELDVAWADHPLEPLYEQIAREMRAQGFGTIDLYSTLRRFSNSDLMLWGFDGHTNAFSNRLIAQLIFDRLARH